MELWLEPRQCTGCGACDNVCPKKAITMKADACGFVHPAIDNATCINCGLCEKTCPVVHPVAKNNNPIPTIYAGWSKDGYTRYHSTSGGAFSELCKGVYARGGVVVGALYESDMTIAHHITTDLAGLDKIRQSKYAQSLTGDVFRDIKNLLKKGKEVLYCGAPCQVAGLLAYLKGAQPKLITVDFICRGSNSPKAYRKWLDELETKYKGKVTRVWFKNKECGWNRFSTRVDFDNGKVYRKDRYHDLFMKAYLEKNLYIRPCCGECLFKGLPRLADITLADFWSIDKSLDADLGTSMLIVSSEKGAQVLAEAKERLCLAERTYEEALKGNRMLDTSAWISRYSASFLQSLDHQPFSKAYYKTLLSIKKHSLRAKIRKRVDKYIKRGHA